MVLKITTREEEELGGMVLKIPSVYFIFQIASLHIAADIKMMEISDTAIFCVKTGQKTSSERVPNLEIRIMNHDL